MKIMMEGNVSKKKKDKYIGAFNKGSVSYFMVLTDQPRLYLMTPFNDRVPKPQEYKKDLLLYDKLKAGAIKKDKF